jgi:hypothetical protein
MSYHVMGMGLTPGRTSNAPGSTQARVTPNPTPSRGVLNATALIDSIGGAIGTTVTGISSLITAGRDPVAPGVSPADLSAISALAAGTGAGAGAPPAPSFLQTGAGLALAAGVLLVGGIVIVSVMRKKEANRKKRRSRARRRARAWRSR